MKPADLKPGHRIPIPASQAGPAGALVVIGEPVAERDDFKDRDLISIEVAATGGIAAIGPGELMVRSGAGRVQGLPSGRCQVWRISYPPDTDVEVEQ